MKPKNLTTRLPGRPLWTVLFLLAAAAAFLAACSGVIPETGGELPADFPTRPAVTEAVNPTPLPEEVTPPQSAESTSPPAATAPDATLPAAAGVSTAALQCTSPATLTPAMAEGPYYTPDSPERSSLLEEGMEGTKLTITGFVLDTDCQPVEDAWLDFWQADAAGNYDNSGYILRGHQFTDAEGRYMLETVLPGEYPGRTQHIHVKVQVPGGRELVTQMFFPGAAGNSSDRIFDQELLVEMEETTGGLSATFNFVVETE